MFETFVKAAMAQDNRNCFSKFIGDMEGVPSELYPFYRECNPEDVEVFDESGVIRFVPAQRLLQEKQEYSYLDMDIVVATINGDPVFMKGQKVYTCPHGIRQPKIEKIADSFEKFIETIILPE